MVISQDPETNRPRAQHPFRSPQRQRRPGFPISFSPLLGKVATVLWLARPARGSYALRAASVRRTRTTRTTATPREALVHVVEEGRGGRRRASKPMPCLRVIAAWLGWSRWLRTAILCDLAPTRRRAGRSGFHVSLHAASHPPELSFRGEYFDKKPKTGGAESHSRRHGESSPRPRAVWVWSGLL